MRRFMGLLGLGVVGMLMTVQAVSNAHFVGVQRGESSTYRKNHHDFLDLQSRSIYAPYLLILVGPLLLVGGVLFSKGIDGSGYLLLISIIVIGIASLLMSVWVIWFERQLRNETTVVWSNVNVTVSAADGTLLSYP